MELFWVCNIYDIVFVVFNVGVFRRVFDEIVYYCCCRFCCVYWVCVCWFCGGGFCVVDCCV